MDFFVITQGCKVNQFESQAIVKLLTERGHRLCSQASAASVVIINTCAVTAEASRKARQAVRRARSLCGDGIIAVCGCWSQLDPGDAEQLGADLVSGSGNRRGFVDELEEVFANNIKRHIFERPVSWRTIEQLPAGAMPGHTRSMLKVQDGCANYCSYCIIPYLRGPVRSLAPADAAAQAAGLASLGTKEIVITGIELASYGLDLIGRPGMPSLLSEISKAAPGVRLRLGSLEPRIITQELCEALCDIQGLCAHFHLSLQSGCDATLRRMGRKYDTARFIQSVDLLRKYFPHCGLTADLIVGFPGETEAEHKETMLFITRCAFSDMHIFPYSKRPGTPAANMPGQVTSSVKRDRAREAAEIAEKMKESFLYSCIGSTQSVLFESGQTGHAENYCEVEAPEDGLEGLVLPVYVTGTNKGKLTGSILTD